MSKKGKQVKQEQDDTLGNTQRTDKETKKHRGEIDRTKLDAGGQNR